MRWIWIDPGETVGWATGEVVTTFIDGRAVGPTLIMGGHGNTQSQPFLLKLLKVADEYDVIGYESYQIRQDKMQAHVGSHVPTIQVIGGIRLCAWEGRRVRGDGRPQIIPQRPQEKSTGLKAAPNYVDDSTRALIQTALSGDHKYGHYGDAMLHAIAWHHHNTVHDLVR